MAQLASSCVRSIGNLELTLNPKQKVCFGIHADSKFPMPAAHRFFEPVPPGWTTLASVDQTVKLWATRPLTPDMRIEQQAVNLWNMWFAKPLSKAEIPERIRCDQTISEPVRKQALALAERYRKT